MCVAKLVALFHPGLRQEILNITLTIPAKMSFLKTVLFNKNSHDQHFSWRHLLGATS